MIFSTLVPACEQLKLAPMATLGVTMMIATTRALAPPITILPCLPIFPHSKGLSGSPRGLGCAEQGLDHHVGYLSGEQSLDNLSKRKRRPIPRKLLILALSDVCGPISHVWLPSTCTNTPRPST